MAVITKIPLSGTPAHGRMIKVVQTATLGDTIHTATGTTVQGEGDDIVIYAFNSHTANVILTLEMGGVSSPDDLLTFTMTTKEYSLIVPGFFLRNALVVTAFADVANVVMLHGHVLKSA